MASDTQWGYTPVRPMYRKRTIFILVFALMTTFLAPARFALACPMQSQAAGCPMMAARRKVYESLHKVAVASCCAKKATTTRTSSVISSPCCCKMQPAPAPPSLPEATITAESPYFALSTLANPVDAPLMTVLARMQVALEVSAPRGPPLPFTALRAPPVFS